MLIIAFVYNNNIHANIDKAPQNLLIKYITNLENIFKNRILKKNCLLQNEQNNYETLNRI